MTMHHLLAGACAVALCASAAAQPQFELLGEPVHVREMGPQFTTQHPDGYHLMWGSYQGVDGVALISIRTDTGETTRVPLDQFRRGKLQMTKGPGETVLAYAGNPGHFLKYDPATEELTDLGIPVSPANYWMGTATAPDGRWYVGPYPTETEAKCFLWDCATEEVVWTGRPVPGSRYYRRAVRATNGLIYGTAGTDHYYAFDPTTRETVFTDTLPFERLRFPYLSDKPVGEAGLIVGLADDAVFAIDPADHTIRTLAQHESIKRAHGFNVTADGVLYYGSDEQLWRCDLRID